jgi:hypothetical protein
MSFFPYDERDEYRSWMREREHSETLTPPQGSLLDLLRRIEQQQKTLDQSRSELKVMIGKPPLDRVWSKFAASGGMTASDFERFMQGRLRPRVIEGRRHHLRLITTN